MTAHSFLTMVAEVDLAIPYGEVRRVMPGRLEASGPAATVGDLCRIGAAGRLAEVAAVDEQGLVLVPVEDGAPVAIGARVEPAPGGGAVGVGDGFGGRAIDALGRPLDGGPSIRADAHVPSRGITPGMLDRVAPDTILETGVRAIDALMTLGKGQRIGVFAASGVGKTSLVEQLVAQVGATRRVLCLVGERGREVEGFWRALSQRADADRCTLVAATSDESAAMRARCVSTALCLAEYWRDRGEHVLLIIDSVTRLAMALREIGLAAGEPPTVRAYTPNVFAALPRIVERCGAVRSGGAITAVMTVLSETDEVDDPIVETMKSLLDGHIVLSRSLADRGHFPAIDATRSISRQASRLIARDHADAARAAAAQLATYDEARVMIQSGIYQAGTSVEIDAAVAGREALIAFLRQGQDERTPLAETVRRLGALGRSTRHG
ncbi:flagellar protein FliI [Sphingomonas sp. Leaf33]|uniref:FliI/YscN family ATPase n=1 Tax=Sphingomonas sp. Leaf33 TaxID=1736215 RepID=UPI0006F2D04F|nr:FliI/YscN family ATPase [Sphingomonas sp. Leaf33]KQN21423.1 flagellar protein FliI [Sphingomonas sp. Leaf33]